MLWRRFGLKTFHINVLVGREEIISKVYKELYVVLSLKLARITPVLWLESELCTWEVPLLQERFASTSILILRIENSLVFLDDLNIFPPHQWICCPQCLQNSFCSSNLKQKISLPESLSEQDMLQSLFLSNSRATKQHFPQFSITDCLYRYLPSCKVYNRDQTFRAQAMAFHQFYSI